MSLSNASKDENLKIPPTVHSWNGKAPIRGRRLAFLEGFKSRKNKTIANLQFMEMPDPLRTWPGPS
jgi:hypothetical protein